jgi:rare lipoprotein A
MKKVFWFMTGGKEMYSNYNNYAWNFYPYQTTQLLPNSYGYRSINPGLFNPMSRQQPIRGQATWTNGGQVTKCGIPWSDNQYMTAAVGADTPYKCGQTLKVRNLSTPGAREILVTVVDQVPNYPANRISLHRRAFQALGAPLNIGVINVEILPSPELEQEKWGKYLLEITQSAYPGYNVIDYKSIGKTKLSAEQIKETYEFILQSTQGKITVRGNVTYNPKTDRIINFNISEV